MTAIARPLAASRLADSGPIPLEAALAMRARSGDPKAFRQIFERFGPGIRRFLRDLLGGDDAAADEATQESFVRAHGRLGELRDQARIGAFLFGIARNVAYEQLRARGRARPTEDAELGARPHPAPSPEALVLGREADEKLGAALAALGEERRAALLLRVDHELAYEDIARAMDWSLAKVKNEIHRARLELRARLVPYLGGSDERL